MPRLLLDASDQCRVPESEVFITELSELAGCNNVSISDANPGAFGTVLVFPPLTAGVSMTGIHPAAVGPLQQGSKLFAKMLWALMLRRQSSEMA